MEQTNIINVFQDEFHRVLTPMEKEILNDWKNKYTDDLIIKCLKEGVYNGVTSFRYINKILESSATEKDIKEDKEDKDLSWLD